MRIAHFLRAVAARDPLPLKVHPVVRDVVYSVGIALACAVVFGRLMYVEVNVLNTILVAGIGFPLVIALNRWVDSLQRPATHGYEVKRSQQLSYVPPVPSDEYLAQPTIERDMERLWFERRFPPASVGETIDLNEDTIPVTDAAWDARVAATMYDERGVI